MGQARPAAIRAASRPAGMTALLAAAAASRARSPGPLSRTRPPAPASSTTVAAIVQAGRPWQQRSEEGHAGIIGSAQILAPLARISSDGATIAAAMMRGFSRQDTARFAFLLATPVIATGLPKIPGPFGPPGNGIRGQILPGRVPSGVRACLPARFKAVSDDRRHELLARALGIAQDAALRDKRRALGRALAAGIAGDDARIDDELLFIRRSPTLTSRTDGCSRSWPANGRRQESSAAASFTEVGHLVPSPRDSGFGDSLPALIWTLEAHGLIRAEASSTPWQTSRAAYNVTQAASQLLERLAGG